METENPPPHSPAMVAPGAGSRLERMFAALSATNEAMLRAKDPEELFQRVCDAAVHGGRFSVTLVVVPGPDMLSVRVAAATGPAGPRLRQLKLSIDETRPEGRGLIGTAFRTQRPCVTNDFLNDPRLAAWHEAAREGGTRSAAGLPLVVRGRSVGVLLFYSHELGTFDEALVSLLERMAENV